MARANTEAPPTRRCRLLALGKHLASSQQQRASEPARDSRLETQDSQHRQHFNCSSCDFVNFLVHDPSQGIVVVLVMNSSDDNRIDQLPLPSPLKTARVWPRRTAPFALIPARYGRSDQLRPAQDQTPKHLRRGLSSTMVSNQPAPHRTTLSCPHLTQRARPDARLLHLSLVAEAQKLRNFRVTFGARGQILSPLLQRRRRAAIGALPSCNSLWAANVRTEGVLRGSTARSELNEMPATRDYGTPRKQKPREDFTASMAVNGASSASVAMMDASFSYESGESSATYEFSSQRSDEPAWNGIGDHPSSLRRRPATVEAMRESARLSDKRLHELGSASAAGVNWRDLDLELAAASLSDKHQSVWRRKKLPRGYTNSDAMKLFTRLTIRDHRHQTRWGPKGFAVLAEGLLPCSVQEMRLVFKVGSTDVFRDMMRGVYRREFVEGELLRSVKIQNGAGNPAKAWENQDLSVKATTFDSGSVFSRNEDWCFLELLQPRNRAKEEQSARTAASTPSAVSGPSPPAFTRTLVSISPSTVVLDNALYQPSRVQRHVPNVVINYSFEEDSNGRGTRVVFHGEYLPPDVHDAFKRASHERRLARLWLLRLAASCHRFMLVVRRRRLGMQVMINSTRLPLETVANVPRCACCRRTFSSFFKRSRKRLCCLCGFLVCDKCAHVQEREHRARGDARPQIEQVRVCERCLVRVDQARYNTVTEEDLQPARVVSDSHSPVSRANSTPSGSLRGRTRPTLKTRPASLNDLLLDTLADATAGGAAQRRRKASVLSVMRDIVDEERARRRSSAAHVRSRSTKGLPLLGEHDEVNEGNGEAQEEVGDVERLQHMWGEDRRWEDDYPLANADSRSYPIEFPEDPAEVIMPPIPSNEFKRLQLIREQQLNELGDVPELGIICSLASKELSCAVSMITVVDKAQLHVLASTHPAVPGGHSYPRSQGFCAQTILDPKPLVSRHVQADVRFSAMSSVRKMGINFYCGFPLMGSDGKTVIGSVCCADPQARDLTRSQYAAMNSLASTASRVVQRAAERRALTEESVEC